MFDHVGINVRDFQASRAFYERALSPLGYRVVFDGSEWNGAGFGTSEDKPEFWIMQREPSGTATHVAFHAEDRATVDAFHAAALAAGGTDNGAPALRPHYHPDYYGAFVLDPDSHLRTSKPLRSARLLGYTEE